MANIMIVDDSASMRQLVSFALKDAGHNVVDAIHGKDALSKLQGADLMFVTRSVVQAETSDRVCATVWGQVVKLKKGPTLVPVAPPPAGPAPAPVSVASSPAANAAPPAPPPAPPPAL